MELRTVAICYNLHNPVYCNKTLTEEKWDSFIQP